MGIIAAQSLGNFQPQICSTQLMPFSLIFLVCQTYPNRLLFDLPSSFKILELNKFILEIGIGNYEVLVRFLGGLPNFHLVLCVLPSHILTFYVIRDSDLLCVSPFSLYSCLSNFFLRMWVLCEWVFLYACLSVCVRVDLCIFFEW